MNKTMVTVLYIVLVGVVMYFVDPLLSRWNEVDNASIVALISMALLAGYAVNYPGLVAVLSTALLVLIGTIGALAGSDHYVRRMTVTIILVLPYILPCLWVVGSEFLSKLNRTKAHE